MGRPRKLVKDICSVKECEAYVVAKSICFRHYMQLKDRGYIHKTGYDRRKPRVLEDRIEYELQDGQVAIFDIDFKAPANTAPSLSDHGYVRFGSKYGHRLVLVPPADKQIDHINNNKLDNRKANLRICTEYQNQKNKPKPANNKSGYVGVYFDRKAGKWASQVQKDHKRTYVGSFTDPLTAAIARDEVAERLHGSFAHLNFRNEL